MAINPADAYTYAMQGTRDRVLDYVIHNREARVEDLADALGITSAAVRRHLDNLRADGLVDVTTVRQPMGRPYYAYHPTEAGLGAVPEAYAGLLSRILLTVDEKQDVASAVALGMAETVASRHREDVTEHEPQAVVAQVTATLKREGILDSWRAEDDGFHLINGACPYRMAAEISSLPCESDRKVIELLVGEHVEQMHRIVDGSPICEYLVRAGGPTTEHPSGS